MTEQPTFQTQTCGKWILCGEHAVLRGHRAILFPVQSKAFSFSFYQHNNELRAEFSGTYGEEMQFLFWSAWERALALLDIHHADIPGQLILNNNVPIGTGMGGSAALSVAISRFLKFLGYIEESELTEFSRQIENLFHNESSGADIAVTYYEKGIIFSRLQGLIQTLEPLWQPNWYLSYSGGVSSTSRCVQKVKQLFETNPSRAHALDEQMGQSVGLALNALLMPQEEGLPLLAEAIQQAAVTFQAWELTEGSMRQHLDLLNQHGAIAAKPTGSGGGGYVISLWENNPPHIHGVEWIKV